jgi:hypothetical protein
LIINKALSVFLSRAVYQNDSPFRENSILSIDVYGQKKRQLRKRNIHDELEILHATA